MVIIQKFLHINLDVGFILLLILILMLDTSLKISLSTGLIQRYRWVFFGYFSEYYHFNIIVNTNSSSDLNITVINTTLIITLNTFLLVPTKGLNKENQTDGEGGKGSMESFFFERVTGR